MVSLTSFPDIPTRIFPKANNFIREIVFHGCARPWYVYVEAFAPAFIELLITLAIYDLEDLMRARGESIVRKGQGQRFGLVKHLRPAILAKKETPVKKYTRGALKTLLVLTKPLEAIGFTFLLYFAIDRFYGRWQSLIEKSDFCKQPIESGPLSRRRDGGRVSILPGGAGVFLPTLEQNRSSWSSTAVAVALPQGWFRCFFGLSITGPVGGISGVKLRLFVVAGLGGFNIDGEETSIAEDEEATLLVDARFFLPGFAGGSMAWELVGPAVPVGLASEDGFMTVSRTG